jgi:hypothetical protein
VLAVSLRLPDWLLQGWGGAGVVTVVVVVLAAIDSFGCRISYRNSGIMGTETKATPDAILSYHRSKYLDYGFLGYDTMWRVRW